jgi:hypothetical protein
MVLLHLFVPKLRDSRRLQAAPLPNPMDVKKVINYELFQRYWNLIPKRRGSVFQFDRVLTTIENCQNKNHTITQIINNPVIAYNFYSSLFIIR